MSHRLLIVEDSMLSAFLYKGQVERRDPDFAVHVCFTLAMAKEEWAIFRPHIILLDLNLPDSEGEETLPHIREFKDPDHPSLVIAMSVDPAMEQRALESGADDFMVKIIGESALPLIKRLHDLLPKCAGL